MNVQRIWKIGCAVVAVGLLATACSSSSKSTTASSSGSSSASAGGSASAATGTPILVGGMGPATSPIYSLPNAKPTLQAAIDAVNAAGGVNGHPLKLDYCDTTFTSAGELSCARQMVSDKVVAVISPTVLADQSGAESKLFSSAGIVEFATTGSSPTQNINPNSYLLSAGVGWLTGALKALKDNGATKVALMADANPTGQFVQSLYTPGVSGLGLQNAGAVLGDTTADPTYAATAAKVVATGADGVFVASTPSFALAVKALQQAGYKGKIATASSLTSNAVLTALGSSGNGIFVSNLTAFPTDTSNPSVAKVLAAMKQYAPSTPIDTNTIMSYTGIVLFADVAKTATTPDLDAAGFKAAVNNISTPIVTGLVGPWAIKGQTSPVAAYPRILNPTVVIGTMKDGAIYSDGKGFENPFV